MKFLNTSFQMFHIDNDDPERDALYQKTSKFFNNNFNNLNSPTIKMSTREDYDAFVKQNPDFLVDPNGYEYPARQYGWKFGELGLWASTFLALKNFLKTKNDYLLVLEDDVEISDGFREHLQECLDYLKTDFDVFMFFNPNNRQMFNDPFSPEDIGEPNQTWSTLCYVITKAGAQKTLDYIARHGISLPIDWHYLQLKDTYKTVSLTTQAKMSCRVGIQKSTIQNTQRKILEDSRKKVLFVVHRYAPFPGGSENYVKDMAEEMLSRGYNVNVLTGMHQGNLNGVWVTSDQSVLDNRWDLIVVHGAEKYQYTTLMNLRSFSNPILFLPIELQHHGVDKLKTIFSRVKYIGYSTNEELKLLERTLFMPKVEHVRHGINAITSKGVSGFKKKYGINTKKMFLSSGGFWNHKNMQNLIDIFQQADIEDTTLVLTGYHIGNNCENLTFDSNKVRVLVLDDRNDVMSAMVDADLYILNSYKEGFGLVLLESMLNELPWASRNTPGALDMAKFGFVYREDQDLLSYLKTYEKPDTSVGLKEIMDNRLIKNTVDDIISIIGA